MRHSEFLPAYIIVAVMSLINSAFIFYIPIYLAELGFEGFKIGLLVAIYSMTGILFVFQAGIFTDRLSPRRMLFSSLAMVVLFWLGFSYAGTFWPLVAIFFVGGLGITIYRIAMDSFVLKNVTESLGQKIGNYVLVMIIPSAIGGIGGGFLLSKLSFPPVLRTLGVLTFLLMAVIYFVPKTATADFPVMRYLKDFANWRVISFAVILFLFTLHWGIERVAYTPFLEQNLGLSFVGMGWFMSLPIVLLGAAAYIAGKRYDKGLSPIAIIVFSFVLSGAGFALMAMTDNVMMSLLFRGIHEIGDGVFMIFMFTGAASYFTKARMGGNFALITFTTVLGTIVGSLIFSPVGFSYGYALPHIIWGVLAVVLALFLLMFRDHR